MGVEELRDSFSVAESRIVGMFLAGKNGPSFGERIAMRTDNLTDNKHNRFQSVELSGTFRNSPTLAKGVGLGT